MEKQLNWETPLTHCNLALPNIQSGVVRKLKNAIHRINHYSRGGMNVFPQCTAIESNISKSFVTSSFGNETFVASTSCRLFVSGNGLLFYRAQFLYLAACVSMKGQCTNALCNLPLFTRPLRFKRRLLL